MPTELDASTVSVALAGLFVAGVGAVYAYTRLGAFEHTEDTRGHKHDRDDTSTSKDKARGKAEDAGADVGVSGSLAVRNKNKKRRKAGAGAGAASADDNVVRGNKGKEPDGGRAQDRVRDDAGGRSAIVVPGDFEAGTAAREASLDGTAVEPGHATKARKKKKKKGQGKTRGGEEDKEEGEEDRDDVRHRVNVGDSGIGTGKEALVGHTAAGDSTDADTSVSLPLSVSGSMAASSREVGYADLPAHTRPAPPSQPQERARGHVPSEGRETIRPSLSFDTDSSWTHVDRRRLEISMSTDGSTGRPVDAMEVTSSDMTSTESNSPVMDRMEGVASDIRGTRADPGRHTTLAEKLVPRPEASSVDDMLERPNVPTLARVMRVRPPTDETPVPGFSWDDYGDVVGESWLVHDADQEDEGEWGIVKSRNRTRPLQTQTRTTSSTPPSSTAPETMTKKQRQNARKRELAKAVKTEAEETRLQGLAKHKRELERLRVIEQSRQGSRKQPSGGMHATMDDRGSLVWEQ